MSRDTSGTPSPTAISHDAAATIACSLELPPFGRGPILAIGGPALRLDPEQRQQTIVAIYPPGTVLQGGPSIRDASTEGWRSVTRTYALEPEDGPGDRRRELIGSPVEAADITRIELWEVLSWVSGAELDVLSWVSEILLRQVRVRVVLGSETQRRQLARDLWTYAGENPDLCRSLGAREPRLGEQQIRGMLRRLGYAPLGRSLRSLSDNQTSGLSRPHA